MRTIAAARTGLVSLICHNKSINFDVFQTVHYILLVETPYGKVRCQRPGHRTRPYAPLVSLAKMHSQVVVVLLVGLATAAYALDLSHAEKVPLEMEPRIFSLINDFYAQVVYPPLNHIVTSL